MLNIIHTNKKEHFEQARVLFRQYADSLGFDLDFQGFHDELAGLDRIYSPPSGSLLLCECSGRIAGCVGLRRFAAGICEMKRLYVPREFRGRAIGRRLAEAVIEEARKLGYTRMRLDTIDTMAEANALYRSLGFRPIDAYRHNPISGAVYYELTL